MSSFLANAGFSVMESNSSVDALKIIEQPENTFDLLIIDFNLPKLCGSQLVEKIRKIERYKKTPIMILSKDSDKQKKLEAKNAGATGWMKKPIRLYKFLNLIEMAF